MATKELKYPNKSHRKFNNKDIEMIVNMYNSGTSALNIANELKSCQITILNVLHRAGVMRTTAESKTIKLPKQEIINLYTKKEWSATKIAKKFNVDAHTILKRLRLWNVEIVKIRQPKILTIDMDRATKQYLSGISASVISKKIGVSESALLRRLKEYDVEIRQPCRPEWKPLPIKSITNDYKKGLCAEQIALKHNCSLSHVLNKLHKNGIKTTYNGSGMGHVCKTKAGETVRSSLEMIVANWFYTHKIEYKYEPKLKNTRYRPDFIVNKIYIEVCGVLNNHFGYDDNIARKVKYYENNNLDFILLYPSDINNNTLKEIFRSS